MNKVFKSHKELMEAIITTGGNCMRTDWCLECPFSHKCILSYIDEKTPILLKEDRVQLAYNKLFTDILEEELENDEGDKKAE